MGYSKYLSMRHIKKGFILINGIDEADWKPPDFVHQSSEMLLLVRCLVTLKNRSIGLLFTSRPGNPVAAAYKMT